MCGFRADSPNQDKHTGESSNGFIDPQSPSDLDLATGAGSATSAHSLKRQASSGEPEPKGALYMELLQARVSVAMQR